MKYLRTLGQTIFVISISALPLVGQHANIDVAKHATAIPKICESVAPANIEGALDLPALVKEARCKGAGDMLGEYTYAVQSSSRQKDKKGKEKIETFTYEVFFPTLKSGMRTKGIKVVTSHNGVPVPPQELEKERLKAAERTEKEEEKIASQPATTAAAENIVTGMRPLGWYGRMAISHESFGRKSSVALAINTFLKTCDLTLARRAQVAGRETLIFTFAPRPNAQFADDEKYIAQLSGEIWIDATDRIVMRLAGWLAAAPTSANTTQAAGTAATSASVNPAAEKPPVVYLEMMRLSAGIWLPRVTRINGADYPKLFDGITTDSNQTHSDYIHFSTEIKDVKTTPPISP